jgi:hypothetical protein
VIAIWLIVSVLALLGTGLVVATVSAHVWQPAVVAALVNAVWLVVLGLVLLGTRLVVLTIAPYVWPAGAARRRSLGRWVAGVAAVVSFSSCAAWRWPTRRRSFSRCSQSDSEG